MPAEARIQNSPTVDARPSNTGLHGAFWTQLLLRVLRVVPTRLALVLVRPIALVIYLLAGQQRRAVRENLRTLHPEFGRLKNAWAGYRVFLQFALTYLDRLWHLHFHREVTWDIPRPEQFKAMHDEAGGVLLFTVHSGNYDIGATLFSQKFDRILNIVRIPEQTEALQALRAAELERVARQASKLRVHYNRVADNHLGLELCRLLMAGEAVAVQGDRVVTGVSPMELEHDGRFYRIPRGPLVLAEISRAPCYPIFLQRLGCLHYRIQVGSSFPDERCRAEDIGRLWLTQMDAFVREHWDQWFVFEPLVSQAPTKAATTPQADRPA